MLNCPIKISLLEEIADIHRGVKKRLIIIICSGLLCGFLVFAYLGAMFLVMLPFFSIGELQRLKKM